MRIPVQICLFPYNGLVSNYRRSDDLTGFSRSCVIHLRSPGEHKEDFRTGSAAALRLAVSPLPLAMPNTQPPLVSYEAFGAYWSTSKFAKSVRCFIRRRWPSFLDQLSLLCMHAPALKIYLDQTYGPLRVRRISAGGGDVQLEHADKPSACMAEEKDPWPSASLSALWQTHPFLSRFAQAEIELIARAKERSLPVTCEVAPHHLFLNEADALRLGPYGDMRPTPCTATPATRQRCGNTSTARLTASPATMPRIPAPKKSARKARRRAYRGWNPPCL